MGTRIRIDVPKRDIRVRAGESGGADSSWSKRAAILSVTQLLLWAQTAFASGDFVSPGSLVRGETAEEAWVGCVNGDEGMFYLAPRQVSQDKARDFRTWQMVRVTAPESDSDTGSAVEPRLEAASNALRGRWVTAPAGSSVESGMRSVKHGEEPDYLGLLVVSAEDAGGAWIAELRLPDSGATADPAERQAGSRFLVKQVADDCEAFEKERLDLAWQQAPKREDTFFAVSTDAVEFERLVHPATGIESLRLLPGPILGHAQADTVNREIQALAKSMNEAWSFCEYYEAEVHLAAASPRLVVLSWRNGHYCGGAHPNEDQGILSFDPASAEPVDVTAWLEAPPDVPLPPSLWDELEPMLDEACLWRLKNQGSYLSIWLSHTAVNVRIYEDARPYIYCEGDYPLAFDLVREAIRPENVEEFDAIVESLTGSP